MKTAPKPTTLPAEPPSDMEGDPQVRASIGLVMAIGASILSGWYVISHHATLIDDTKRAPAIQARPVDGWTGHRQYHHRLPNQPTY